MSPFPRKNSNSVCATPMTVAMELYNWLNETTKSIKLNNVKYNRENL